MSGVHSPHFPHSNQPNNWLFFYRRLWCRRIYRTHVWLARMSVSLIPRVGAILIADHDSLYYHAPLHKSQLPDYCDKTAIFWLCNPSSSILAQRTHTKLAGSQIFADKDAPVRSICGSNQLKLAFITCFITRRIFGCDTKTTAGSGKYYEAKVCIEPVWNPKGHPKC